MNNELIAGKYRVVKKLGRGGMGEVYKVRSLSDDKILALKLAATKNRPEEMIRLQREFHILSRLSHPDIVQVYDFDATDDGRPYFTMEYVAGSKLTEAFPRFNPLIYSAIYHILSALGFIHSRGLIHGDIKPENIIAKRGKAKLLDFGLVDEIDLSSPGQLKGTLIYMAPELLRGERGDGRADLYSLGVVLYETLTGRNPFSADDPLQVIRDHLEKQPPPPSRFTKELPKGLDSIVLRLLEKEPSNRYSNAEDVLEDLSPLSPSLHKEIEARGVPILSPGLIGRDEELRTLMDLFSRATKGVAQSLLLAGKRGVGKSRLLREFKFRAQLEGASVLLTSCSLSEKVPLQPFRQLIEELPAKEPSLGKGGPLPDDLTEDASSIEKLKTFRLWSEQLAELSVKKPIVLIVDDLDFGDETSLELFSYLARSFSGERILMVGGSEDAAISEGVTVLELSGLTPSSTVLMASCMLEGKGNFEEIGNWVHQQTGGNPLLVEETIVSLVKEDNLRRGKRGWELQKENLNKMVVPKAAKEVVEPWLSRLSPEGLGLLRIASILGDEFDPVLLKELSGYGESEYFKSLEELLKDGWLVGIHLGERKGYAFSHRWMQRMSYEQTPPKERSKIHRKAARLIESTHSIEGVRALTALAYHSLKGGMKEKAYRYNWQAASEVKKSFANQMALEYYGHALALSPRVGSEADRAELLEETGDLHTLLGEYSKALKSYHKSLQFSAPDARTRLQTKLGRVYEKMGDHDQAMSSFEKGLSLLEGQSSPDEVLLLNWLGWTYMNKGELGKARRHCLTAKRKGEALGDLRGLSQVHNTLSLIAWRNGDWEDALKFNELSIEEKERIQDTFGIANSLNNLGIINWSRGEYSKARQYYERSLAIRREIGDIRGEAEVHNNLGLISMTEGEEDLALDHFETTYELFHRVDNREALARVHNNLGMIFKSRGEWQTALDHYQKSLELMERTGERSGIATSHNNIGNLLREIGEWERAEEHLSSGLRIREEMADPLGTAFSLRNMGWLHKDRRALKEARRYLSKSLALYRKQKALKEIPLVLELLAEVYMEDDPEKALQHAEEGLALAEKLKNKFDMGRGHRILGMIYAEKGESGKAQEHFRKAISTLEGLRPEYELGKTYLQAGEFEIGQWKSGKRGEDSIQACSHIREAGRILHRVGVQSDLDRVYDLSFDLVEELSKGVRPPLDRENQLQTLYEVSKVLNSILDLDVLLNQVIELAIKLLNAERGVLFLLEGEDLVVAAGRDTDKATIGDASRLSKSIISQVATSGEPVISLNALQDPKFKVKESVILNSIRSLLCVPLKIGERVIGTIYVDSRIASNLFSKEDKEFLKSLANLTAVAIDNAKLHKELKDENVNLRRQVEGRYSFHDLVGGTEEMQRLYNLIEKVADTDTTVLLQGETGTGKELVARAIHNLSNRALKKFVAVLCSALPETLLESELFGHTRGSFTGAIRDKAGLFHEADGGTIFLDEIGEAPSSIQTKLLRVLEQGEVRRIGDTAYQKVDVRVVCATNRDLEQDVKMNRFREDLYYRLNVIPITIPPLRERKDDIPLLARYLLKLSTERLKKDIDGFTPDALRHLISYDWPGNVRELENIIERAVVMGEGRLIRARDLNPESDRPSYPKTLKETRNTVDRERIEFALALYSGNVTGAAEDLGIHRQQLQRLMRRYGIQREKFLATE